MADMLFTIGADDRDFHRALGRIEASSGMAAKSLGKIFGVGSTAAIASKAIATASSFIQAYADSSDEARQRVDRLTESVQRLKESIGEDLVGAIEVGKPSLDTFAGWWQDIINKEADVMRWAFFGDGFMGESARIDQLREQERQSQKRAEQQRKAADYRLGEEADILGAAGDAAGERRMREDIQHRRRMREIGAMGLPSDQASRLYGFENARHDLAGRAMSLQEVKDLRDKLINDRRSERFNILENSSVADATTRRQIIGSKGFAEDFQAEFRNAQRDLVAQGRQQLDALRQVEKNTRTGPGAKFR